MPALSDESFADDEAGYMAAQSQKSDAELSALKDVMPPVFSGVEQSEEMLKWIWENFSAVAGDQPSFECWRMSFIFFYGLIYADLGCSNATVVFSPRSSTGRLGHADWRTV